MSDLIPPKTSRQSSNAQPQPHPALAPDGPLQILLEGRNFRAYFSSTEGTRKDRVFIWYQPEIGLLGNLYWCESGQQKERQELDEKSLPVVKISDVYLGKKSPELKSVAAKNAPEERCFTLVTKALGGTIGKSLHLECASEQTRSAWLAALSAVFQLPMRDQTRDRDVRRANGLIAGLARDLDGIRSGYDENKPDKYGVYRKRPNMPGPNSVPGTGENSPRIDPVTGLAITPREAISGTVTARDHDDPDAIVAVGHGTQQPLMQLNVHDTKDTSYDEAVVVAAAEAKKGEQKQEEKKDEKLKLPSVETAIYVLTTGTTLTSYWDPTNAPASNSPVEEGQTQPQIEVESKEMFCFGHFFDNEDSSADVSPTSSFALYWCDKSEQNKRPLNEKQCLQFKDITDLYHGKKTKMFTHSFTSSSIDAGRCFSVSAPNVSLHLSLADERERNEWFFSLYRLLLASTTVETTGSGELADSVARMIAEDLEWQKERDREAQEWAQKDNAQFTK